MVLLLLVGTRWNRLRRVGGSVSGTEARERRSGVNLAGAAAAPSDRESKDDPSTADGLVGFNALLLRFWRTF